MLGIISWIQATPTWSLKRVEYLSKEPPPGVTIAGPSWNTMFGLGKPSVWQVKITVLSFSRQEASGSSTTSRVSPVIVVFVGTEIHHSGRLYRNMPTHTYTHIHIHTHIPGMVM